jgi:WD40 repeat protein
MNRVASTDVPEDSGTARPARPANRFKYRAFMSYSHAADDHIAPQLQKALSQFARPWRRIRALRIFRDQTNLALNPHLWADIQQALDQSEFFILLASPEAAQSEWVRREIAYWLATRSPETLLMVLTKGEIIWDRAAGDFDWARTTALPPTLSRVFADEPLYSDFRQTRTAVDLSLRNPDFLNRVARIAATLHGQSLDELIGEDIDQHRKFRLFTRSVVTGLAALFVAVAVASWIAWQQRTIAVSRELAATSLVQVTMRPDLGLLLALEAVATSPTAQAEQALREMAISASVRADLMSAQTEANTGPKAQPFVDESYDTLVLRPAGPALQVADHRTGATLASFTRHMDTVTSAAFSPDGALIASLDEGGHGYVWSTRTGDVRFSFRSPTPGDWFSSVVWSPDGRLLAVGGVGRSVEVLDTHTWHSVSSLDEHSGSVDRIAFSRDSSLLATGSTMDFYGVPADRAVQVWEARTGKVIQQLTDPRRALDDLGFSANGMLVVTHYEDGTTRIWDARSGEQVALSALDELSVAPGMDEAIRTITAGAPNISGEGLYGISNLAFSPDGRFLITVDEEGSARVWRRPALVLHAEIDGFTDNVSSRFTFSSDGTKVIAEYDKRIRIWEIATWAELTAPPRELEPEIAAFLRRPRAEAREVVSSDAHVAIELADDTGARVASVVDKIHGRRLGILSGGSERPVTAAFSPDGLQIAVADGSPDVRIHRWETFAPLDDLIVLSRNRAGRELRPAERDQFLPPTFAQQVRRWLSAVSGR